jgi:hypothetical protein
MKKPPPRPDIPPRSSDNVRRRLLDPVPPALSSELLAKAHYVGSSKHKRNPSVFGLGPYIGPSGDRTLCDEHAGFSVTHMTGIPALLSRGIHAGLIGQRLLWTIADNGWIFEARLTNAETQEYHAYPVRQSEAIARAVFDRYAEWAALPSRDALEVQAASSCRALYGFNK